MRYNFNMTTAIFAVIFILMAYLLLKSGIDHIKTMLGEVSKLRDDIKGELVISQQAIGQLQKVVEDKLSVLQKSNEEKLEKMRQTVDEKLQGTLEKRLGESFRTVSEQLEKVHSGLGEMKTLASDVGGLKRVLSNVKTRGVLGEIQLENILEQILAKGQYETNAQVKADSSERVEYAVVLPGKEAGRVLLPIDAKFPRDSYERLINAIDADDAGAVEKEQKILLAAVKKSAKDISEKYINPPITTDFALLFLPVEGLYAEVLRNPGLMEELQRQYRVILAGPTTLIAILNSFRMGFKTMAIEQRADEVRQILGAVKTEFQKFGEVLDRVKKQLSTAANSIDDTSARTRAMERKLKEVEQLPNAKAVEILELSAPQTQTESNNNE
ncbi:MAG: DNA recombination protein RmuC [Elusimicrobia bacterium]|nr:DNA recombination protein RmuC [Elusimicrobiota bacterium]